MTGSDGFETLTTAYLGQDWELFGSSIDDAIANFVRDEPREWVNDSAARLEALLETPMSEQEYHDRWIYGLHSGYDPRDDGFTFREWFAHALDVLRVEAAKQSE